MVTMADAGDLEKLPPEICREIYKHLLVQPKPITMECYFQYTLVLGGGLANRRLASHRKKTRTPVPVVVWVDIVHNTTSILSVNRVINQEALPVLYGYNKFAFENSLCLELFLTQICSSKQHMRNIAIIWDLQFGEPWLSMDRSLDLLSEATSFRALEIPHFTICGENPKETIEELVRDCVPFLEKLRAVHHARGLKINILDVIKIILASCHCKACDMKSLTCLLNGCIRFGLSHKVDPRRIYVQFRGETIIMARCKCRCEAADDTNRSLGTELREEIARHLGLDANDENDDETT